MFLHDWDNPIIANYYYSIEDFKGIVKPISAYLAADYYRVISFTVTEDVMAMVIDSTHSYTTGSSQNGGTSSTISNPPYFKKLHKGTTYRTTDGGGYTTHLTSYTIYPNIK